MMEPVLQVALDFVDLERALRLAREAVGGGADWLEIGTPLIKSEGLDAIRRFRAEFPRQTLVADMKTMDAGRAEMEMAAKAGANIAIVLGVADDGTIREGIEAGRNQGLRVGVDLIRTADPARRAEQARDWGADHVVVHCGIDEQMRGGTPFDMLRKIAGRVDLPLAAAGGLNSETVADAVEAGARILIVGGAITKSPDARAATRQISEAMRSRARVATDLFKRSSPERLRETLLKLSTANLSDGAHRCPCMEGIRPVMAGLKMVGAAVTVRTFPGDWSKPVQAIDRAAPGDVIVVDAGGRGPAVWGELATHSALQRKAAGIVIDGGIRDTAVIRALGFPAFARLVLSNAGEPKGFGEINVPVTVGGIRVEPGDWIVGDDDGVVALPKGRAVEMANYGMDCLEAENRIRQEIEGGRTTLGQVNDLLRWDKRTG
jgi:3-hexulose-6-phosphate synthase/6-phospho-3-hexuloisomerase